MQKRPLLAIALTAATALALTGCSAASSGASGSSDDGTIRIVASTNVYGDIAKTIGGPDVEVTSIITGSTQDPHSYEASAADRLAVSKADILIENGGGYDDFMQTLRKDVDPQHVTVLNAVDISGLDDHDHDDHDHDHTESPTDAADSHAGHDHGEFNEHVWYDTHAMNDLANEIAGSLSELDPSAAADYTRNAESFADSIQQVETRVAAVKEQHAGEGVAITEPVPLYLLEAMGLENKTPEAFTESIEAGTDVSPVVLQRTLNLFGEGGVRVLAYNEQTSGPETEKVLSAAKQAGVPVVPMTETLPSGMDYIGWMTSNVDAVAKALGE